MTLSETWLQEVIDREVEGVELVMLEQVGGKRQKVVRLYIDHPDGVTHDLCGVVSEVVGKALDDTDSLGGPYTLEVSSPGLERPLRKREHFEAQVGKNVYIRTRVLVEGARVRQGKLLEVTSEGVVVDDGSRKVSIRFGDISSARVAYDFE